jgi:hypothetical protein
MPRVYKEMHDEVSAVPTSATKYLISHLNLFSVLSYIFVCYLVRWWQILVPRENNLPRSVAFSVLSTDMLTRAGLSLASRCADKRKKNPWCRFAAVIGLQIYLQFFLFLRNVDPIPVIVSCREGEAKRDKVVYGFRQTRRRELRRLSLMTPLISASKAPMIDLVVSLPWLPILWSSLPLVPSHICKMCYSCMFSEGVSVWISR